MALDCSTSPDSHTLCTPCKDGWKVLFIYLSIPKDRLDYLWQSVVRLPHLPTIGSIRSAIRVHLLLPDRHLHLQLINQPVHCLQPLDTMTRWDCNHNTGLPHWTIADLMCNRHMDQVVPFRSCGSDQRLDRFFSHGDVCLVRQRLNLFV